MSSIIWNYFFHPTSSSSNSNNEASQFTFPKVKVANGDWGASSNISVTAAALASSMIQAMDSTKH